MRTILIYITFLICADSFSTNATFIFSSVKYKIDSNVIESYNKLEITVNNTKLSQQDKKVKIKINTTDLDTIKIGAYRTYSSQTIVTKLKSGETYEISFNPCSTFEIIPSTKQEGLELVRLVSQNKNNEKLFLNSYFCFVDAKQIWSKDTTDYFDNASSGYCPYAISSFQMCSKDLNNINSESDSQDCVGLKLYFSGREMYTLFYDYNTREIKAKFDGYYSEKSKIKIGVRAEE